MPLLKNNDFAADGWTVIGDTDPIPEAGDVIVSFARLLREYQTLSGRGGRLGVAAGNAERAGQFEAFLPGLALIALPFPAFGDGRSYSIARQLRELGFGGELRATGNILPDQIQFMQQVGFDTFEVSDRFPVERWRQASRRMSLAYQRGLVRAGHEQEIWTERHTEAEPWAEQPHAG